MAGAGAGGGARGAARGFKRTKKDVITTTSMVPIDAAAASELVCRLLAAAGELVGTENARAWFDHGSGVDRVGLGGLNPAVVTATVAEGSEGTARVDLRAAGREGLIKQHPADKALAKVSALLGEAVA